MFKGVRIGRVPSLRQHAASGQWIVKTGGKVTYLGKDRATAREAGELLDLEDCEDELAREV